jgi:hypothetical protein
MPALNLASDVTHRELVATAQITVNIEKAPTASGTGEGGVLRDLRVVGFSGGARSPLCPRTAPRVNKMKREPHSEPPRRNALRTRSPSGLAGFDQGNAGEPSHDLAASLGLPLPEEQRRAERAPMVGVAGSGVEDEDGPAGHGTKVGAAD